MVSASRKQEQRLAKVLGGRATPASGAIWRWKGDVRTSRWLVEAKTTSKQSFSLKGEIWDKIRREALLDGRLPAIAVGLAGRNLVVMDEEDFLDLCSRSHLDEGEVR